MDKHLCWVRSRRRNRQKCEPDRDNIWVKSHTAESGFAKYLSAGIYRALGNVVLGDSNMTIS